MKDMNICKKRCLARSHNRGRRSWLDTFSSNGVGSIEIAKCAIFSTNCTISCNTRTHFLRGRRAKNKQTKWRKKITSVIWFLSSFPPLNLRYDLEDNLFDYNSEYEDCECNCDRHDHVIYRSEGGEWECFWQIQLRRDVVGWISRSDKTKSRKNLRGKWG